MKGLFLLQLPSPLTLSQEAAWGFVGAILGAAIGGILAYVGTIHATRLAYRNELSLEKHRRIQAEADERSRRRVQLYSQFRGLRHHLVGLTKLRLQSQANRRFHERNLQIVPADDAARRHAETQEFFRWQERSNALLETIHRTLREKEEILGELGAAFEVSPTLVNLIEKTRSLQVYEANHVLESAREAKDDDMLIVWRRETVTQLNAMTDLHYAAVLAELEKLLQSQAYPAMA